MESWTKVNLWIYFVGMTLLQTFSLVLEIQFLSLNLVLQIESDDCSLVYFCFCSKLEILNLWKMHSAYWWNKQNVTWKCVSRNQKYLTKAYFTVYIDFNVPNL